jgi:hypothetical protein
VEPSLDRANKVRYAEAFYHAVVRKDLRFDQAETFAQWWAEQGYVAHKTLVEAFASWYARGFGRIGNEEE